MNTITYVVVAFSIAAGILAGLALGGAILEERRLRRSTARSLPVVFDLIETYSRQVRPPLSDEWEGGVPDDALFFVDTDLFEAISLDMLAATKKSRAQLARKVVNR